MAVQGGETYAVKSLTGHGDEQRHKSIQRLSRERSSALVCLRISSPSLAYARTSSTLSSLLEMAWPRSKSGSGDSNWEREPFMSARHERTWSWRAANAAAGEGDERSRVSGE